MPMYGMLCYLLFAGTCLCVCGAPVLLSDINPTQDSFVTSAGSTHTIDVESAAPDGEQTTGLLLNVGAGGGTGPHGRPEGIDGVTQTQNGDSLDGRSRPSETGGEASSEVKKIESTIKQQSEALSFDPLNEKEEVRINSEATGRRKQVDTDMSVPNRTPAGLSSQLETSQSQSSSQDGADMTKLPGLDSLQDKDPETSPASLTGPPNPSLSLWNQKPTFHSPIPPLVFVTPRTSTSFVSWSQDGATMSSLLDILPEIRPNLMPKEDGPESLWTVATRPVGDSTLPLPQDEATETTMSSEALPLIFEPFEDAQPEGAAPGRGAAITLAQPPGSMAAGGMPPSEPDLEQLVTSEANSDNGPSHSPAVLMPDWTSMWQTSGADLLEPISSSGPSMSPHQVGSKAKDSKEKVAVKTPNLEDSLPSTRSSLSSLQHHLTTVSMATHRPAHRSRPGLEEMESDEEHDEDEEDENSEESVEEDSEEDLTETPKTSSTPPPYSLIPPPPVWVHSNQGLMRSWVELIKEKAGYVSGMLAPVGIGITGALLIVGALYSIRMIHRKRRNSFKHQRRKVRQPEQPREPSTSRQDQAMLLADSSEDEF